MRCSVVQFNKARLPRQRVQEDFRYDPIAGHSGLSSAYRKYRIQKSTVSVFQVL